MKMNLLALAVFFFSTLSQAQSFTTLIPANSQGASCNQQASEVARKFESLRGVTQVTAVDCVNSHELPLAAGGVYTAHVFAVDYESAEALSLYQAKFGTDVSGYEPGSYYGAFGTIEECVNAQSDELRAFQTATGLAPAFSACVSDDSTYSKKKFVLWITGFGEPKAALRLIDFSRGFVRGDQLAASEVNWLAESLGSQGASVRQNNGLQTLYYSADMLVVNRTVPGIWVEPTQCAEQLSEAQAIFGADSSAVHLECQATTVGVRMSVLRFGSDWMMNSRRDQKYSNFESCMKFKESVSGRERRKDPKGFLGLMCTSSWSDVGTFEHQIFSRN